MEPISKKPGEKGCPEAEGAFGAVKPWLPSFRLSCHVTDEGSAVAGRWPVGKLKFFLLGGTEFGEDEEHFSFQFRFLFAVIWLGLLGSGVFLVGHLAKANSMGSVHSIMQSVHVGLWILLAVLLYGRKENFLLVAWINAIFSFLLFISALIFVPEDELRILWFFLNLPSVYLILGGAVGSLVGVLSALVLLLLNPHLSAPYSSHAMVTATVGFIYLGAIFHAFSSRSISYYDRLIESKRKLRHLSMHDALTGLLNLRAYHQVCDQVLAMSLRSASPLSLLFVDLDHFKRINDSHGHEAGDAVLVAVSDCLQREVRGSDIVGRIGGEEFAVLLPDTDEPGAIKLAEKLREAVAALEIRCGETLLPMTASIGVATRQARHLTFKSIQSEADEAMYLAKQMGRNRVSTLLAMESESDGVLDVERFQHQNCNGCALGNGQPCPVLNVLRACACERTEPREILASLAPMDSRGIPICAMARRSAA